MGAPVILITGALTGIGRATAFAFAKEGATVVASGRREAEGKAFEAELRSLGAEAAFILADVRHEDDVRNLVEQTVARFGRLDIAVNNAGTEGKPGPLAEQTSESYAGMFDTNVLGTLLSLKHELRVMQPQGSGSIITRWKVSRNPPPSKPLLWASASMQSRLVRPRLRCSIV